MKEKFIPQLGQKVYCIYRKWYVVEHSVYALSKSSFIVDGYQSTEEDGQEYLFSDYKKTWFITKEEAEQRLKELRGN